MTSSIDRRRRSLIAGCARLAAIVVVAGVASRGGPVAAKASKSELGYQERPRDGKECADCKLFEPGIANSDIGQCLLVDGPIRRDGWCMAFSPKNRG